MLVSSEEIQLSLAQLILLNGLQTDANVPGCEKLTVTCLQKAWLATETNEITNAELGVSTGMAPAMSIFMVKGWNRATCALGVLYAMYTLPALLEARRHLSSVHFKRLIGVQLIVVQLQSLVQKTVSVGFAGNSRRCQTVPETTYQSMDGSNFTFGNLRKLPRTFAVVWANSVAPDLAQVISTNRGVTLASSVRRKPNCFNIVHQLEVQLRSGVAQNTALNQLEA